MELEGKLLFAPADRDGFRLLSVDRPRPVVCPLRPRLGAGDRRLSNRLPTIEMSTPVSRNRSGHAKDVNWLAEFIPIGRAVAPSYHPATGVAWIMPIHSPTVAERTTFSRNQTRDSSYCLHLQEKQARCSEVSDRYKADSNAENQFFLEGLGPRSAGLRSTFNFFRASSDHDGNTGYFGAKCPRFVRRKPGHTDRDFGGRPCRRDKI